MTKKTTNKPAAKEKPQGLRIVSLEVENVKRLKLVNITPKGDVLVVSGKNGSGKTSVLDSISYAITGTSDIPTQPIRAGQGSARIKVDLGDYIVTRTFTRVDAEKSKDGLHYLSKMAIEGKNREQFRSPQQLLNSFMGTFTFDPLAFTRMEPKAQLAAMRGLVTFSVDIDALDAESKDAYGKRRDLGRDLDNAKARLSSFPALPEGLPEKPVDTEELTKKLATAAQHNTEVVEAEQRKRFQVRASEEADREMAIRKQRIEALRKQIVETEKEIREQEDRKANALAAAEAIEIPERVYTEELSDLLVAAQGVNAALLAAAAQKKVQTEVEGLQKQYDEQNGIVDRTKAEREKALAEAEMPLDGLSIGDGEVLYKGLPFNQASNAEQIRVSMAMAIAAHPKLRVALIRDGSLLDDDSMAVIAEMAEAENFQVIIERVGGDGKVGIVMENGEASGDEAQAPARK